ncbi:MAG: acyl-CoA thioesterase [Elsteraceae bacterium]
MTNPSELTTTFPIEWGDCDAAGIVFYPNYFRWFDAGYQRLLKTRGHTQATLQAAYGVVGTALVDAGASFRAPARYDQTLTLTVAIAEWRRATFRVTYRGAVDGRPVIDGHDVRAFVKADAAGALSAMPIPANFRALFES